MLWLQLYISPPPPIPPPSPSTSPPFLSASLIHECHQNVFNTLYIEIKHIIKFYIFVQQNAVICTLQQEVLKFKDICVSWNSPKTNLEKKVLNFENLS